MLRVMNFTWSYRDSKICGQAENTGCINLHDGIEGIKTMITRGISKTEYWRDVIGAFILTY